MSSKSKGVCPCPEWVFMLRPENPDMCLVASQAFALSAAALFSLAVFHWAVLNGAFSI